MVCTHILGVATADTKLAMLRCLAQVMDMLDRLYLLFDKLSREHDIFKVETIGDAYMAVSNLVKDQDDHTKRIASFAIDVCFVFSAAVIHLRVPRNGAISTSYNNSGI